MTGFGIDFLGDGIGQRFQRRVLTGGQSGLEGDVVAEKFDVLHGGDEFTHDLAAHGGPAAVFDDGDLALLQIVRGEIVQQVFHGDEHAGVVGRRGEDQVAAAEGVGDNVACGRHGGVIHPDPDTALDQFGGEDVGGVLRVAVDRGVGEHDALFLGGVAAPEQVLLQKVAEVAAPDKAVQRADQGDVQRGGLLQDGLDLGAVLADDVGVVAAGLTEVLDEEVGFVVEQAAVKSAEGAEGVGGEKELVRLVIGHHDLGPVDHRGHDEVQIVPAGGEAVPLLDQNDPLLQIRQEELGQHGFNLGVAENAGLRVTQQQALNGGGVVRLHVGDEQVVQLPATQGVGDVFKKDFVDGLVAGVKQNCFFVQKEIGVVADAVGNSVNTLKTGEAAVIGADPDQVVMYLSCAMHSSSFPSA